MHSDYFLLWNNIHLLLWWAFKASTCQQVQQCGFHSVSTKEESYSIVEEDISDDGYTDNILFYVKEGCGLVLVFLWKLLTIKNTVSQALSYKVKDIQAECPLIFSKWISFLSWVTVTGGNVWFSMKGHSQLYILLFMWHAGINSNKVIKSSSETPWNSVAGSCLKLPNLRLKLHLWSCSSRRSCRDSPLF